MGVLRENKDSAHDCADSVKDSEFGGLSVYAELVQNISSLIFEF